MRTSAAIACMLMNTMSSCSMMAQSIGSVLSGTTYPSDDPEMLAVEADYAAREAQLQEEIDNIESSHPGYDEYRYDLGMIGHGYVVKLDLPELKELVSLMRRSSNNLNQLTRKVHETGRVYDADLEDISQWQEQLWEGVKEILTQLSKLS